MDGGGETWTDLFEATLVMTGTSDASTSASSGSDNLEDTLGSTHSNQFSFGTTNNQKIVETSNAAAQGVPSPLSPDGSSAAKLKLGELQTETNLEEEVKPRAAAFEQPPSATTSPGSASQGEVAADDDDDGDHEFTFGTTQQLQMPDMSHVPKPKLTPHVEEGSLRQAGHNSGECRDLALLGTISEVPPRPRSPPPSTILPPPPSSMHPHPYVSPRLPHPHLNRAQTAPWNLHMQTSPLQQQLCISHSASPMMYATHPGMVYDPNAAYNQVAMYDAACAQAQAHAQAQYHAEAQMQAEAQAHFEAGAQVVQPEGYDPEAGHDPQGDGNEYLHEEFDTQKMPLAIKIAFMLEACCAECSTCKHLDLKKIAAFGCGLVLIGGGIAMVAVMASSRWS